MDLILWLEKLTGSELVREVSILVLVDLILWLIFSAPAFFISSGFNPCFGGSYIVTIKLQTKVKQDRGFNPCFGGSYIVTGKLHRWLSGGYRFQSLFWWILYCDTKEMKTSCLYGRFNPCFGGSYIVTKGRQILENIEKCFNPCFGGSYIVTTLTGVLVPLFL